MPSDEAEHRGVFVWVPLVHAVVLFEKRRRGDNVVTHENDNVSACLRDAVIACNALALVLLRQYRERDRRFWLESLENVLRVVAAAVVDHDNFELRFIKFLFEQSIQTLFENCNSVVRGDDYRKALAKYRLKVRIHDSSMPTISICLLKL